MRPAERFEREMPGFGVGSGHSVFNVAAPMMGLAPGGRMREEICEDPFDLADWDLPVTGRCYVHLLNSAAWRAVTAEDPPPSPPAADYSRAGLPWFSHHS